LLLEGKESQRSITYNCLAASTKGSEPMVLRSLNFWHSSIERHPVGILV